MLFLWLHFSLSLHQNCHEIGSWDCEGGPASVLRERCWRHWEDGGEPETGQSVQSKPGEVTAAHRFTLSLSSSCALTSLLCCCCRWKASLRTSTTPPSPCCRSSPHCSTTSPSTSLATTSWVSDGASHVTSFWWMQCNTNQMNLSPSASSVDDLQISCYRLMCSIYSLGTVKTPHAEK